MVYQTNQDDLKSIRQKYKHKRMESKNALVNHYRSLSLMQEDDLPKPSGLKLDMGPKDEFDDISSIYTAKENKLDTLRKRIVARDKRLSMMNGEDVVDLKQMKEEMEIMNQIEGKNMDEEVMQQKLAQLDEIKEELKEEQNDLSKILDGNPSN